MSIFDNVFVNFKLVLYIRYLLIEIPLYKYIQTLITRTFLNLALFDSLPQFKTTVERNV